MAGLSGSRSSARLAIQIWPMISAVARLRLKPWRPVEQKVQASAQGLLSLLTFGLGWFLGTYLNLTMTAVFAIAGLFTLGGSFYALATLPAAADAD